MGTWQMAGEIGAPEAMSRNTDFTVRVLLAIIRELLVNLIPNTIERSLKSAVDEARQGKQMGYEREVAEMRGGSAL